MKLHSGLGARRAGRFEIHRRKSPDFKRRRCRDDHYCAGWKFQDFNPHGELHQWKLLNTQNSWPINDSRTRNATKSRRRHPVNNLSIKVEIWVLKQENVTRKITFYSKLKEQNSTYFNFKNKFCDAQ